MENNINPIDNMFEEIIQKINAVKEAFVKETNEDLSDWNMGQISDDQLKAMLILGRTQEIEFALNQLSEAALASGGRGVDRQRLEALDTVRNVRDKIREVIETGENIGLYKEKVSLLMSGQFLNNDEVIETVDAPFTDGFEEIINIFDEGRRSDGFMSIKEEIYFGIPEGKIRLCDIEIPSSRYNLPEGYYVAKMEGMESDKKVAFNASEILTVTIESVPNSTNFINPIKTTEYRNPGYEETLSEYNRVTLLEKEERTDTVYRCYVADEKQAYNVLLYEEPSEEYQERLHFYVEDTDGNAIAAGHADSLLIDSAENVMKGIGVYGDDIDSITYRLCDSEERKIIHDRSLDMSRLPCIAEFAKSFKNLYGDNQINQEVIYCSDNAIAAKFAQYRSNEIKRLGQEQNIDFSFSIKNNSEKAIKKQKEKERYEEERIENYYKKREEIEEQKKREQRKKEEEKGKAKDQKKKIKNSMANATAEMLLLKELFDLKAELSQVKTEIFNLRKELASKEKNMEAAKKDTKKRAAR